MKKETINELGEHIVTMNSADRGPLTEEEKDMIAHLNEVEDEYDEDCPPMPEAMRLQMMQDIAARNKSSVSA